MSRLFVVRIQDSNLLRPHQIDGIQRLLIGYQDILADDFTPPESLLENTLACIPYLWLVLDESQNIYAIGSLTDVIPGRHAFLHGLADPYFHERKMLDMAYRAIFNYAFKELGLHKLKAEFDADNLGAKGFCRKWGFVREAHLREDTQRTGQKQDVVIYSLFATQALSNSYI